MSDNVKVITLAESLPITRHVITDARINEICAMAKDDFNLDDFICGLEPPLLELSLELPPPLSLEPLPPYKWQMDAISCLSESLINSNLVCANIACGAGKSRVIIKIIQKNKYQHSVIFVPAIALLEQFRKEVAKWAPDFTVSLVGGGYHELHDANIVICTYNSEHLLLRDFDLIVVDEAHHVADEFLENCEDARIYADAIINRCSDESRALLVSATMPESDVCEYSYTIGEAVRDDTIVDYHIVIPIFGEGSPVLGLLTLIHTHPEWTRILAYCNTVQAAVNFAAACSLDNIKATSICASTSLLDRRRILTDLAAGVLRVIASVHTLGEGIDIREADTCIFVEPRGGRIDVPQCVGRVQRKCPETGKSVATVVLPAADEERELVRFMRIMIGADARLHGNRWRSGGRTSIISVNTDVADAELLAVATYDRLGVLLGPDVAWQVKYNLLLKYVEEFDRLPTRSCTYKNTKLGDWVHTQRQAKKDKGTGKMTPARIAALESVPGWFWKVDLDATWQTTCDLLCNYVEEYGRLPSQSCTYKNVKLGSWIDNQRSVKKGRGRCKMTPDRITALEKVPGWKW